MTPDGKMHHVKRAKDVAKLFPEQKKQIRRYAAKNRLRFSKKRREASLAMLVEGVDGTPNPVELWKAEEQDWPSCSLHNPHDR